MTLPIRRDAEVEARDPFRELDDLQNRMAELMRATFGSGPSGLLSWEPPVDIEETDDAFLLEAEVPGVRRQDVDVELVDNQLTIRGEVRERERTGILRRRTRRTGEFDYRVTLPGEVDGDQVEAELEDGVLRLHVPKVASAQRRRIEVKTG